MIWPHAIFTIFIFAIYSQQTLDVVAVYENAGQF